MRPILEHAVRFAAGVVIFMLIIMVVLMVLSAFVSTLPYGYARPMGTPAPHRSTGSGGEHNETIEAEGHAGTGWQTGIHAAKSHVGSCRQVLAGCQPVGRCFRNRWRSSRRRSIVVAVGQLDALA